MRPFALMMLFCALASSASAQLSVHDPALTAKQVARVTASGTPVRLAYLPASDELVVSMLEGRVFVFPRPEAGAPAVQVRNATFDASDHGLTGQMQGMVTGPDGSIYVVETREEGANFVSSIARRTPDGNWHAVAGTEPYPRSGTPFDHRFNGMQVSDDGVWLYVSSGSRTDHGEVQGLGGAHPFVREAPLTSAMLRIPAGSQGLLIPAGEEALAASGLVFADGFRNAFDIALDGQGRMFATENGWDRDGPEELNLIVEGGHYGFPWKLGIEDNPQWDPDYNPGSDLLLNPSAFAVSNGFYTNDRRYPDPAVGTAFTDPIRNFGPDAARYRSPLDGSIVDAALADSFVSTFTGHGSPLGLTFDRESALPAPYTGGGFFLNWTGRNSSLFGPFGEPGEDLLHLAVEEDAAGVFVRTTRIVSEFAAPIDAVLVGKTLYVLEMSGGRIWSVDFPGSTASEHAPDPIRGLGAPYPNPAPAGLPVRVQAGQNERTLVLYDLLGRTVREIAVAGGAIAELATGGLSPGIYVIRGAASGDARLLTIIGR